MLLPQGMLVFLGFSLILSFLLQFLSPDSSAALTQTLHVSCIKACPNSEHRDLYRAVVCGASIPMTSIRFSFTQTGLIHLLVVSGSHFIVLESLLRATVLKFFPSPSRAVALFFLLFLFALMTKGSPPITRAFISWSLLSIASARRMGWTRLQIVTMAGFLTLPFAREKWSLISLFLSWLAALALETTRRPERDDESFWQKAKVALATNTKVYLALIPPLLPLAIPHPLSILSNAIFAPVMGLVLFPGSLLATIFSHVVPKFVVVTDAMWTLAIWCVKKSAQTIPSGLHGQTFPREFLVIYLASLTLLITLWKRRST